MTKLSEIVKCKNCKKTVEGNLRDHWFEEHPVELEAIDKWLGRHEDKAREWEKVVKRQEEGEEI